MMILPTFWRFSCLALLLSFPLFQLDAQTNLPPAFRTNAEMVLVPVTVTDHDGKTILGLQASNFNVFEDQIPQKIVSFTSRGCHLFRRSGAGRQRQHAEYLENRPGRRAILLSRPRIRNDEFTAAHRLHVAGGHTRIHHRYGGSRRERRDYASREE